MNPLELACSRGHHEILEYFINDLGLRSIIEFNAEHETLSIEEMHFIYVPIVLKSGKVIEKLLDIPTLWTYEDLLQISRYIK